jgi:hypothetical protein
MKKNLGAPLLEESDIFQPVPHPDTVPKRDIRCQMI